MSYFCKFGSEFFGSQVRFQELPVEQDQFYWMRGKGKLPLY